MYETSKATEFAFDLSLWHGKCPAPTIIPRGSNGVLVYCPDCRCIGDLEAVGNRISHEASKKEKSK